MLWKSWFDDPLLSNGEKLERQKQFLRHKEECSIQAKVIFFLFILMVCYVCLFLSVCLFICRFAYLSVNLLLYLCTCFFFICVRLFICLISLLYFAISFLFWPSVFPSICLSVCQLHLWLGRLVSDGPQPSFLLVVLSEHLLPNSGHKLDQQTAAASSDNNSPFFSQLYFEAPIFQTT